MSKVDSSAKSYNENHVIVVQMKKKMLESSIFDSSKKPPAVKTDYTVSRDY